MSLPGLPALPPELAGPVAVQLAKPVREIPQPTALSGGCRYEPKWDGYRLVVVRDRTSTRLWSKQGRDLTDRFPDVAAAAVAQLPPGSVVDGEVVIWHDDRLDFGLLQRRMVTAAGRIAAQVAAAPASYVAFDLLAAGGEDLRRSTFTRRRAELERLAARWAPPLQLSPVTADPAEARRWFDDFRPAGVEGLVVKGAATRYAPGRRDWLKVKSWETTEVLAGGVIGPIERPSQLVAGRYRDGELVVVGRTSPLSPEQSAELAGVLRPAGADHPWPERIGTGRFGGGRLSVPLTRVEPTAVVEVSADAALQAGVFRHPLRFVRVRPDLLAEDLPGLAAATADVDSPPAVLFVDVDDFKTINDTLGHAAGDELLLAVAARLSADVRGGDVVARLGGDEFALLLTDADADRLRDVADRLLAAVRLPVEIAGRSVSVTASIGGALAGPGATAEQLLHRADTAMYSAKRGGKDSRALLDTASGVH
nr:diguanylate cyclase [Blastococcus saxobsidens]